MAKLAFQRAARLGFVRGEQPFPTPTKRPRHVARFTLPAGAPCAVRRVTSADDWQTHRTRIELGFERFEKYERTDAGNFWHFRKDGWIIAVHRKFVKHRDDGYKTTA